MSEPWLDPMRFGILFGAIGGGVGGTLIGLLGALTGILAPKGKGRTPLLAAWAVFAVAGIASLAAGVVAVAGGQPYGIWYPLVLVGGLSGLLCTFFLFMTAGVYRQAEARKLAAEEMRRA